MYVANPIPSPRILSPWLCAVQPNPAAGDGRPCRAMLLLLLLLLLANMAKPEAWVIDQACNGRWSCLTRLRQDSKVKPSPEQPARAVVASTVFAPPWPRTIIFSRPPRLSHRPARVSKRKLKVFLPVRLHTTYFFAFHETVIVAVACHVVWWWENMECAQDTCQRSAPALALACNSVKMVQYRYAACTKYTITRLITGTLYGSRCLTVRGFGRETPRLVASAMRLFRGKIIGLLPRDAIDCRP